MFNIGDTVQVSPVNLPPGWEPWADQVGVITAIQGMAQGPLPNGYQEVYTVHNDVVGDMTLYSGDLILVTPTTPTTAPAATTHGVMPTAAKDWSLMPPQSGPPLPIWLGVYWPWVKAI